MIASLVPDAGHVVHMPGHIYVHVDRWADAAAAFEASTAVDRAYMRDEHEVSDHTSGPYSHNLLFLATVYGYQGRYRDGMRVAAEILEVAPLELEGRILAREGQADAAVSLLKRALDAETRIGYSEPPLYPHPMQEVLGQALLDLKRWPDAEAMFNRALQRDPGSGRAWFGVMKAREGAGHHAEALAAYREFRKEWARADADLPQLRPMQ